MFGFRRFGTKEKNEPSYSTPGARPRDSFPVPNPYVSVAAFHRSRVYSADSQCVRSATLKSEVSRLHTHHATKKQDIKVGRHLAGSAVL
jgi:hypothetical protein